jgi:hypothetical protein
VSTTKLLRLLLEGRKRFLKVIRATLVEDLLLKSTLMMVFQPIMPPYQQRKIHFLALFIVGVCQLDNIIASVQEATQLSSKCDIIVEIEIF